MKKYVSFLSAIIIGVSGFAQEIPNGNFKTFTAGVPNGWTAANPSLTGSSNGFMRVRYSPNAESVNDDTLSVYVTAKNIAGVKPGIIVSGNGVGASVGLTGVTGGFPYTSRPKALSGYLKYASTNSNHGGVSVIVTHWNGTSRDTLGGYAGGIYTVNVGTAFVYHNIPITYKPALSSVTPDSVQIVYMSSQSAPAPLNETAAIGDTLYADMFRFSSCMPDLNATLGNSPIITSNPPSIQPGVHDFILANTDSRVINYTFTAAIPAKASGSFLNFPVTIDPLDSIHANTPMGLPPGITVTQAHPSATLYKNSIGCYTLSGTLPSTNDVKYTIIFENTIGGSSSFFSLGFDNPEVASQGARPSDTVTFTIGNPVAPTTQTYTPGPAIAALEVKNKQKFDGGVKHSVFVCSNGTVKACGDNTFGQIGDGTNTSRPSPVAVSGLTGVVAVAAGQSHSIYLKSDGTVWASGSNKYGQLGIGSLVNKSTPQQITTLSNIVAISANYNHSLFLKDDGTVWACGRNYMILGGGQLGDGTTTQRTSPIKVNIDNVAQISGGAFFSLFLKKDGTAWAVGANYIGQLGDGTKTQKTTPIQITSLGNDVREVSAGFDHSVFLKKDGSVYTCGLNASGELADETTVEKLTPFKIQQLSQIVWVDAGSDHNIYLKNDGTVYGSGINGFGELGDGSGIERHTTVMANITDVNSVSAGDYFTLYGKNDSTIWASGMNRDFQLGDGTFESRYSPVEVTSLCSVFDDIVLATGIHDQVATKNNVTVYPNPNTGRFIIRTEDAEGAIVTVTNMLGETIYSGMILTDKLNIDLSNQSNGVYQYLITQDQGVLAAGKIVVLK
jgi:alpha-tubulin suppressor-like RCC1 family protein